MTPGTRSAALAAALLVAAVAIAVLLSSRPVAPPPAPAATTPVKAAAPAGPRVLATLPEFVLSDENGRSIDLGDLRGSVWVADFIFTRCAGPCPIITQRLVALSREAAASASWKAVKFVSITVDPEHDRPEVLKEYGRTHGADPAHWSFLTGTREAVRGLVRSGFKLPVDEQSAGAGNVAQVANAGHDGKVAPVANVGGPIVHSQAAAVVDREGRIRGVHDATTDDGIRSLREALAAVVAEPAPIDIFVPPDLAHPAWLESQRAAQLASAGSIAVPHDFQFTDQVGASGITFRQVSSSDIGKYYRATHYDHGTAVAAADVDGDGRTDLFFANQVGRNGLFRNLGAGHFEDITAGAGVAAGDRACVGAAFADIDNDGDQDLFVSAVREGNMLFENDGRGRFKNITASAGVAGADTHSSGALFFDYDGDGLLDLFVTNVGRYTEERRRENNLHVSVADAFAGHLHPDRSEVSFLYRNLGSGHFTAAGVQAGLVHAAWSGDAAAFDQNGDGRPDLYVPSMQGHDELWLNRAPGHFERDGRKAFPFTPWGSIGIEVLDWNGDGRLDVFVTDMHTDMSSLLLPEEDRKKHDPRTMFPPRFLNTDGNHVLGNALFSNRGGGRFEEQSDAANVETGWPWGPSAADLNADGWQDLFIAAGMNYPYRYRGNDILLNESGKRFAPAEYVLGIEPRRRLVKPWFELECDGADAEHDLCTGETSPVLWSDKRTPAERGRGAARKGRVTVWAARASRSAVILDLDGDGDLDIVTNEYNDAPQVLLSDLTQRGAVHWLAVKLVGKRSNRDGIGALVTVQAGGRAQVQWNDGKSGYLAQSALPLYFGLGAAARPDSVAVDWPGGKHQVVRGPLQPNAQLVVNEP